MNELTLADIKGKTIECVIETTTIVQQRNYCEDTKAAVQTSTTVVLIFTDGERIDLSEAVKSLPA